MFSIAAINDSESGGQWEPLAPTKEAQEFYLTQKYHEGLLKLQAKEYSKACELLEEVLKDPMISKPQMDNSGSDHHLQQLRYLSLKNLGAAFLQQGSDYYERALHCYLQAVELDGSDSVAWNQLGTLSCTMGLLSTARWTFEQGLLCSPNNWNFMEKLLEVLIAIGDEVACLSIADLILRHWPSHSRALHVKNTIENSEQAPFAPRGIDRLEPKHARLQFSRKRRSKDDETELTPNRKKVKSAAQLQLHGASWLSIVEGVLQLLTMASKNGVVSDEAENDNLADKVRKIAPNNNSDFLAYNRVDICLATDTDSSEEGGEKKVNSTCAVGSDNAPFDQYGSTDKENTTDREYHQERRSSRLESLRSRKSGKDEAESTKDVASVVLKSLDSFVIRRLSMGNATYSPASNYSHPEVVSNSSVDEPENVTLFLSKITKNGGPYHIGHLLLEEFALSNIPFQDYFMKLMELEKYTRQWGEDRTAICSLFLAELFYDQALCSTDKTKCSNLFAESSYHLCKVIEFVALHASDLLMREDGGCSMDSTIEDRSASTGKTTQILNNADDIADAVLKNLSHQESSVTLSSCKNMDFWVRFYWLSGCLSLISSSKEKAYNEFHISLDLLRSSKRNSGNGNCVLLPHCKIVKSITENKIIREINFIKLDALFSDNVEFTKTVSDIECLKLLPPLLLSTKDVCADTASYLEKDCEKLLLLELSALDVLISACEKTEPLSIQVYLDSYARKLQLQTAAAGMGCLSNSRKEKSLHAIVGFTSEDTLNRNWMQMVGETVKDISRNASKIRNCIDQQEASDAQEGFNAFASVIHDIQSLLLNVICGTIKVILRKKSSSSELLDQSDQIECWCLVDAAIAFCKLQQMDPGVNTKSQVELIVAVHDLLAEYGLCCAGQDHHGEEETFLKFAIKHLLVLDVKLKAITSKNGADEETGQQIDVAELKNMEVSAGSEPDQTQDEEDEIDEIQSSIDGALDQSFFCLYGLKINPDSLSEDDVVLHKNTSRGDYQTKEQCADVFQYILPYAHSLSRTGLVKLRRVFRAIRKHFPQPPQDILVNNAIDRLLDGPDSCESKLWEIYETNRSPDSILSVLFEGDKGHETFKSLAADSCGSHSFLEVYCNLYYLMTQSEETSATDKHTGFVLKKEGEEFVEQSASLLKYDLLFNPLRFESWQKLANVYDEEVDLLLNDGSKQINILDWKKNYNIHFRVDTGRRRSKRCLLISLILASTPNQQSEMNELLALVYYDSIQNVVPYYDQRSCVPVKDGTWMRYCEIAMKHFEKAFSVKSEWLHAFYLGKLSEKLGQPPAKAFSYYSRAAELNPTAVDPVYRMHSSRLKLLYKHGKQDIDVLQIVAAHAFNKETKENFQKMLGLVSLDVNSLSDSTEKDEVSEDKKEFDPAELKKGWHLLYDDCLAALRICTQGELKHFHKARYKLAQGLYHRGEEGDLEKAKEELSFCFKSSRSAFTVNMWEIDGVVRKGRRKSPNVGGPKKNLAVSLSESSRKFISCIRKYMLFYFVLLEKTADLSTLERAYTYLRTDKRFALCISDIIPLGLGKYVQVLASAIRNPEIRTGSASLEQLLEKMFSVFMDHANVWSDLSNMPELSSADLSESNLYGFIHQYIHLLESDAKLDMLEGLNEKIRKRFKTPKLTNSNFSRVCKHGSIAWCRCIILKLAAITPLPNDQSINDQPSTSSNGLQLYVDLQPDELLISSLEGPSQVKGLDMNWFESLNRIKNLQIKQAAEENLEIAVSLLKCSYNLYRESSSGTFPSGINLYTVSPSPEVLQPPRDIVDVLELSVPRKLLLWAFTLVQGSYMNISAVVKCCEEMKSRIKKGTPVAAVPSESTPDCGTSATGLPGPAAPSVRERMVEQVESCDPEATSAAMQQCSAAMQQCVDAACTTNSASPTVHTVTMPDAPKLSRCNSLKAMESAPGGDKHLNPGSSARAAEDVQESGTGNTNPS